MASSIIKLTTQAAPLGEHPQDEFHFPFGVLINPEPLSGRSLNVHYEAPPTCKTCGAFTADHAPWSPRTDPTSCPFCTSGNHRITENAADFIVSASSPPPYPPPTIIAVDLGAPHDAIEHVKDALIKALESLPDTAPIALLAYGQFVSAYRLLGGSGNDGAHADVLVQRTGAQEAHIHIAPLSSCRPILINALESLRGQPCRASNLSRLTRVLQATEELLEKQNIASMHPQVQAMERPAGVAGRLIIISAAQGDLSGGTSSSDEVEEAMEGLAERAASCGIIADAVLVGTSPGFGAALGTLVYGTGGVLLPQAAAGSALASNLKSVLVRQSGMNCTLEIRCSSGLEVVDAVGPLLPVSQGGQSVSRDPETASLPHRLQSVNSWSWLCNTPEAHQGMAITLQTSSPAKVGQDVHLQIALVWKRTDGAKVYRIASKALPVKHADAAVTVADMEAAAIFMAKAIAAHALEKKAANNRMQAEILRRRLVDELKAISMDYGDPATTSQGWFTGPTRYFLPRGSLPLAEMAYLIDQHILQFGKSIDNGGRACFFQLLLSSTFGLAKHMCLPKLHVLLPGPRTTARPEFVPGLAGPALELQAVPPVDLALFLSTAAVLDCGTAVYILHQDQMDERILEACLQLAQHIACSRQPHADVLNVTKGSAAHQAVLEVIRPIVADNNDLRWRQLPLLHGFSTGEIEMGVEKAASCMVPRPSLCQWLRRQNVLLPPAAIGNQVK